MTVAELIEELKKMPQHHPVRIIDGDITRVFNRSYNGEGIGPVVYIDYDCDHDDPAI